MESKIIFVEYFGRGAGGFPSIGESHLVLSEWIAKSESKQPVTGMLMTFGREGYLLRGKPEEIQKLRDFCNQILLRIGKA